MLPVIIASHHRPALLKQTIDSLKKNSFSKLQIIVVDDSQQGFYDEIKDFITDETFYHFRSQSTIGQAKLWGANMAKKSEYIYFADDDIYYLPNWDKPLIEAMEKYDFCIVGARGVHGANDPKPLSNGYQVKIVGVQTGYSAFMKREDWDKYGHFPNYDEDSWLSYEMRSRTGKDIGVIAPPTIIHCGLNSLNTKKVYDYKSILDDKKKYPELIYE